MSPPLRYYLFVNLTFDRPLAHCKKPTTSIFIRLRGIFLNKYQIGADTYHLGRIKVKLVEIKEQEIPPRQQKSTVNNKVRDHFPI